MKVNLCSTRKRNVEGFVCVDLADADIVADLNETWPFGDNSIEYLRCFDGLEHLRSNLFSMNEAYRVLKPNGIFEIFVPSTDGRGAFQDPTHISFWNENSFWYYCKNFGDHMKLCQQYGFKGEFECLRLETTPMSPEQVCHVYAVLRKPAA